MANLVLDFRSIQRRDFLPRSLAQCHNAFSENWPALVQKARWPRNTKKKARVADSPCDAGRPVEPAFPLWRGVLAIDVRAGRLEEFGIGVKSGVHHAMSLLFG